MTKIAHGVGGTGAPTLQNHDFFGHASAAVGDIDGDGIEDVAVSASGSDDGGTNTGSLWVLLMNSNGTVRASQEISSTQGGASYTPAVNSGFGISVSQLLCGSYDSRVSGIAVG